MRTRLYPMRRVVVTTLGAALVFIGGLNPFAQTPAPAGQTPPPAPAAPAGPQGRGTAPAPAQGGFAGGGLGAGRADNSDADFSPKEPLVGRSAAEEAKTFVLPTGYRM